MLRTQRLLFMSCKYSQGLVATPECLCLIQDPKVPERLGARSDVIDEALHGSFLIELLRAQAFSVFVKRAQVCTVVSVLWGSGGPCPSRTDRVCNSLISLGLVRVALHKLTGESSP